MLVKIYKILFFFFKKQNLISDYLLRSEIYMLKSKRMFKLISLQFPLDSFAFTHEVYILHLASGLD